VSEMLDETGLKAQGWTPARFLDEALDVRPLPTTNVIKVVVRLPDADKARAAATILATKSAQANRRIDGASAGKAREALERQTVNAETAVAQSADALLAYQMGAQLERLEAEIRTRVERGGRPGTTGEDATLARLRDELYRKRLEVLRRETEYSARVRAYAELKARTAQSHSWPDHPSQLEVIDMPSRPGAALPRPVAALAVIGVLAGFAAGVVVALLRNRRRMRTTL